MPANQGLTQAYATHQKNNAFVTATPPQTQAPAAAAKDAQTQHAIGFLPSPSTPTPLFSKDPKTAMALSIGKTSALKSVEVPDSSRLTLPDGSTMEASHDRASGGIKLSFSFGNGRTDETILTKPMIPKLPPKDHYQLFTGRPMPEAITNHREAQSYVMQRVGSSGNGFPASYFKSRTEKTRPAIKPELHLQNTSPAQNKKSIYVSTTLSESTAISFSNGTDLNGNDTVTYGAVYHIQLPAKDLLFYRTENDEVRISPTGKVAVLDLSSKHSEGEFAFVGKLPKEYIKKTKAYKGPVDYQRIKFSFQNDRIKTANCLNALFL